LTREEMTYDFGGARFDVERDREMLSWIFSQSLFGEATGCYCGAALYGAPDVEAATFLARQAVEEFSHFRQFLRIFQILGTRPAAPHPIMRFLTSHEPLWDHHVTLEMAIGEGLVLNAFYALIDTIDHPDIKKILSTVARQEAGHVEFGERQAMKAIQGRPALRRQLLGLNLLSLEAARRLGGAPSSTDGPAPVPLRRHSDLAKAPAGGRGNDRTTHPEGARARASAHSRYLPAGSGGGRDVARAAGVKDACPMVP